jgi:undecaprenyl-diphosphatase
MQLTFFESVLSGIIQGLTEFLPISSSGHLVILQRYFGLKEPQLFFNILLHLGTLFAVVLYFRDEIASLFTKNLRLLMLIIIGSMPTAVVGFVFYDVFEAMFSHIKFVGLMLIVTAVFLFVGEHSFEKRRSRKITAAKLDWVKAFIIGFVQGIAITPGISRSGSTIATGLMLKLSKKDALHYSFLLSIPAVAGSLLLKLAKASTVVVITPSMTGGMITAFLFGLIAMFVLLNVLYKSKLSYFGIYCFAVGVLVIAVRIIEKLYHIII